MKLAGPAKAAPAARKGGQAATDPYAAGPDSDDDAGGGAKGGRGRKGGGKGKGRRCATLTLFTLLPETYELAVLIMSSHGLKHRLMLQNMSRCGKPYCFTL